MTIHTFSNKLSSIYLSNKSEGNKRYLFLLEFLAIIFTFILVSILWVKFIDPYKVLGRDHLYLGLFNLVSWILLFKLTIIAKVPRTQRYRNILFNFIRFSFVEGIFLILVKFFFHLHETSVLFILSYSVVNLFVLFNFRIFLFRIFKKFRAKGYDLHKVVIFANAFSDEFIHKIVDEKDWGFEVVKIISNSKLIKKKFGKTIPVVPESSNIKDIIDNEVIDEVIYSRSTVDQKEIHKLVELCNEVGVIFRLQSNLSPLKTLKLQLNTLNNSSQLSLSDTPASSISQFLKYLGDLYFSFFMLIFLFPVFAFIALLIRIDSKGPVFFKQERVGLRGRRFKLYKFRTMITDAEKVLEKLQDQNEVDGPVFKIKKDPRITKIGAFLRKTGLDELPQLYNVFKGEMSLIGPRPPLAKEVAQYERWQLRRLSVKPGITCTWQIVPNRNEINFENWMRMDLQYIDNWSFSKDVSVFVKTIKTFFTATGH